jgi:alcohol dehydrogenase, propanol-preferring
MSTTYKAIEVTTPGAFRAIERSLVNPGPGQVRIRVEACGVRYSDVATVEGDFPGVTYPRLPGHEVVGRIDATGPNVTRWKIGQRVGENYSAALAASVSTTAMFCTNSRGMPCRSCKYVGLL